MELARLELEDAADQPADQRAQDTSADDIQRIVDPDIYLRVGNDKGPKQDERPPAADRTERPVDKNGHREMIAGMGGRETGAGWAIVGNEMYRVGPEWIAAGAKPVDQVVLDQVAADEIADNDGHGQV